MTAFSLAPRHSIVENERESLVQSASNFEWQLRKYQEIKEEWDWFFINSLDLLLAHGPDGRPTRVSPSVKRILGFTPDEFMKAPMEYIIHPDDLKRTVAHLQDIANGADGINYESRLRHKDGGWALAFMDHPDAVEG